MVDIIYQVLTSPSAAFAAVSENRPWRWAVPIAVLSSLVFSLVILPNPPELAEAIFGLERGTLSSPAWWLVWLALFPLALVIQAGVLHGAAVLLRGRGSYLGLLCALCFASLPWAFSAPLALLRGLLDSGVGPLLYYLGSAGLFVWLLVLSVAALGQNYLFSPRRAVVTCLIPVLAVFAIQLLVLLLSLAF
jgi:hypothetical protein